MIDAERLAAAIGAWLPDARWCAARADGSDRLTLADVGPLSDGLAIALVDRAHESGADRYVVPVDPQGRDAAGMPALAGRLVDAMLGGTTFAGRTGTFVGHAIAAPAATDGGWAADSIDVMPLGVDASNTSLLVRRGAAAVIVKLFRRCRAGIQPEVEVGAFFARQAPWAAAPRLRGWLDHLPSAGGPPTTLATVHDFVADHRSAWEVLLEIVAGGALEAGAPAPARDDLLGLVAALGRTTGDMHHALASRPDLAAFAPEVAGPERITALTAALVAHGRGVLARMAAPPASVGTDIVARLRALAATAPALLGRLEAAGRQGEAPLIRVHGDYHLGQVLVARDGPGWHLLVIDFEGEPSRSLEARREKSSAVKDVAGMCRSFDYLLRAAARSGGPASREADVRLLEARFLEGYAAAGTGAWWPRPDDAAAVLDAYRLDKALYELAYELDHRPDWVDVPLAALEAIRGRCA